MKIRKIVVLISTVGLLLLNACGSNNSAATNDKDVDATTVVAENETSQIAEVSQTVAEEGYISGLSEETILAIAKEFGGITKDDFSAKEWSGYTNIRTKDTWENNAVFNCSYDLTVGGHIKSAVFQSGQIPESDVKAGKHAQFMRAVADGFTDADKASKINDYVTEFLADDSLWNGGYRPVQFGDLSIGIIGYKDDDNEACYHFDILMEYASLKPDENDVKVKDSDVTDSSEPELPEGQYALNDGNVLYKVGEDLPAGVYHLENYSNDFKCVISDTNAELLEGNIIEGYSKTGIDNSRSGYCANADDADYGLYNNEMYKAVEKAVQSGKEINYDEVIASGTVSESQPVVLEDDTKILLTKADSYILCAGGEAILVLDEEYDQQKAFSEAKLPDFGTWDGNDYTNEGLGIKLHVPAGKKMGWRPSGDTRTRKLYVTGYNNTVEDMPPYIDVIDEVATLLVDISSYTNSSLSVMVYDTSIPVSEMMGNTFHNATPESYIQMLIDGNNRKAGSDPEHYTEVAGAMDDTVFGMDARWVTFVTKDDNPFGWEQDADYNTTYSSVWVSQKDNYLIVTRLKFTFAQMEASKEGAEQYNKAKFDECMDVVNDILNEL